MKVRITRVFTAEVTFYEGGEEVHKAKRQFLPGKVLNVEFTDAESGMLKLDKEEDGEPHATFPMDGFIDADEKYELTPLDRALAAAVKLYCISCRLTWKESIGNNKQWRKTKCDLERDHARYEGAIFSVVCTFPEMGNFSQVRSHVEELAHDSGTVLESGRHKDDPYKEKADTIPVKGQPNTYTDLHSVRI